MRIIILTILLFLSVRALSQLTVYKSFIDFKQGNGESYDSLYFRGYSHSTYANLKLFFKGENKRKEKTKVKCKKIWGFTYKGKLFRCTKKGIPLMLVNEGKIFYYENGVAHLYLLDGSDTGWYGKGGCCYFSKSMNSSINQLEKKFIKKNTQYSQLSSCIKSKKISDYVLVRSCVFEFEGNGPELNNTPIPR